MAFLDLLADWGPYAPALIYLWFAVAYGVAGFRGRRHLIRWQRLTYPFNILLLASFPVLMIFFSPWRTYDQSLLWRVFYYAMYFGVWPLIAARGIVNERTRWRTFGYVRPVDVLLFRRPSETPMPEEVTTVERRSNRLMYWTVLAISAGLMVVGFLCMGIGPCEWLDLATGRSGCLRTLSFDPVPGSVDEIAFSPDGRVMAASIWNGLMQFYNSADGTILWELPGQYIHCGRSVTFSSDNRWVATIGDDGTVSTRDAQTGELVHSLRAITDTYSIKFSPDGKYLAVNVSRTGLSFWRTSDWTVQWVIPAKLYSFDFSADGRWLAAATDDKRVGIWKMTDATVYRTINADVDQVALSPDGTQLATTAFFEPISIWDIATGQLMRTVPTDDWGELAYSPDGQYFVAGEKASSALSSAYQVSFWRVADGQRAKTLPTHWSPHCMAFAAKSSMFAYGDSESLKVFRLRQY